MPNWTVRMAAVCVLALAVTSVAAAGNSNGGTPPGVSSPINGSLPTIVGTAQVGQTLTGGPGTWSGPSVSLAYQWQLCDSGGENCAAIAGATSTAYAVASADVGATFRFSVLASNKNGTTYATSGASAAVRAASLATTSTTATPGTNLTTTTATSTTSGTPTTTTSSTATTPFSPINSTGVGVLDYNQSNLGSWSNLNQYEYLLTDAAIGSSTSTEAAAAGEPGLSLAYAVPWEVTSAYNQSVTYTQAVANSWLATTSSGAYINTNSTNDYVALVGNSAYQQQVLQNLLSWLPTIGAKGVFFDNVVPDYSCMLLSYSCGQYPATAYPSRSAWQSALFSFLTVVGRGLRAHGYYVVANAAGYVNDPSYDTGVYFQTWFPQLVQTGGINAIGVEYWMQNANSINTVRNGGTSTFPAYWNGFEAATDDAQAAGADIIFMTYQSATPVVSVERYTRASFLMTWDGGMGAQIMLQGGTTGSDPWSSTWTANIGTPTGPRSQIASGVWYRPFTSGWVVINTNVAGSASWTGTINGISYTVAAADALVHAGP